jgi:hypothetical protein
LDVEALPGASPRGGVSENGTEFIFVKKLPPILERVLPAEVDVDLMLSVSCEKPANELLPPPSINEIVSE